MSWANEASTEHLMCRDTGIRHRWEGINVVRTKKGFIETFECLRCGAMKDRHLTKTGRPIRTKTTYPDGYVRKGEGRMTKAENAKIRLQGMKRRYQL